MKNRTQGLIFCRYLEQKSIFNSIILNLNHSQKIRRKYLTSILNLPQTRSNLMLINRIIKKTDYLYSQGSVTPDLYYCYAPILNIRKYLRTKKKFDYIIELDFNRKDIGLYNYGIFSILNYNTQFNLEKICIAFLSQSIPSDTPPESLQKSSSKFNEVFITLHPFNKVGKAVSKVKDNIMNDFTLFVNSFLTKVKEVLSPIFNRRELKNELHIVNPNPNYTIINIDHEKIAVQNFIKKLGLDNFSINHLSVVNMLEAIRMYEIGDHKLFREITLKCVKQALANIERKLISLDEKSRYQALKEMNNLDSLKFMVELITDDYTLELECDYTPETLSLPFR